MSPRDTGTGEVLEQTIIPVLRRGGYEFKAQAYIGERPGGRRHKVDYIVAKEGQKAILISSKYQEVGGTAEQKVPFEVISLIKAIRESKGRFERAHIVLGGKGWTLREFYTSGGLNPYLKDPDIVKIVSLDQFMALANQGKL